MWRRSKPFLMPVPALIVIGILFFGGLYEGLIQSLGIFHAAGQSRFTLFAYRQILGTSDFWISLGLTLRVSIMSTMLAACLGLAMSICLFLMSKSGLTRWIPLWRSWFGLPLIVPHLAAAYLTVLLLTQSGWISRLSYQLGFIQELTEFPHLVNDPSGFGIVMAYVWKEAPFIALVIYPVLLRINDTWHDAAQVFGASSIQFVKEVVLPLLMPAWFAASFIVFAFTFSAFEVPWLLGVTHPKMLPVLAYEWYTGDLSERPQAMAIGIILVIFTAILGFLSYRFGKRWLSAAGRGWL